jgi:transcriptional regulator NrdR family protein
MGATASRRRNRFNCPLCSERFTTWDIGFDNLQDHLIEEHNRTEMPDALEMIEYNDE